MELSEQKAILLTKREEFEFLGDELLQAQKEYQHWRNRLSLLKRRSRMGQLIYEMSQSFRKKNSENNKMLFADMKELNKKLEEQLDNKNKINLAETKEEIVHLTIVFENLREIIKQLVDKKVKINIEIGAKEKQLQVMDMIAWNPYRNYGKEMETLKKILAENASEFTREPKGPLGTLFSVKLPSWVALVEHIMTPFLFIFLVDNRQDADRLEEYIGQVYGRYPVTKGYPENYSFLPPNINTSPKRPEVWITSFSAKAKDFTKSSAKSESHFPTLMEMLDFHDEDPVVKNTIGEFTRFEKILLFCNEHEAFSELASSKNVPKNCIVGYTRDFFKVKPYPCFGTFKIEKPNSHVQILKPSTKKASTVLKADVKRLTLERDLVYDKSLQIERVRQLEVVQQIENMQKKCQQLASSGLMIQTISKLVDSLCDEIFNSNPGLLARFIVHGDIHEECFKNAKEAALKMALIARKKIKLDSFIQKTTRAILVKEAEVVEITDLSFE